jgi:hypothetical protein
VSIEELIRIIFSFLGGGLVVAILNWIRLNTSEKISIRGIYFHVGEIFFMRHEFIQNVRKKFHDKVRELQKYQRSQPYFYSKYLLY